VREGCESGRENDVSGNAISTPRYTERDCTHGSPPADYAMDTVARMHRSRLGQIVIDWNGDLERALAFWSAALGHRASRVAQVRTWSVMEAPTGHRFCVLRPQRPDFAERGGMRGDR
jgi:hypothetical protein